MREFLLEIMTPERFFFQGYAEMLVTQLSDGQFAILAGHQPMIAVLPEGELKIKTKDQVQTAVHLGGFLQVRPDKVVAFLDACETSEELENMIQERDREFEAEKIRHTASLSAQRHNKISVTRTISDLKSKGKIE